MSLIVEIKQKKFNIKTKIITFKSKLTKKKIYATNHHFAHKKNPAKITHFQPQYKTLRFGKDSLYIRKIIRKPIWPKYTEADLLTSRTGRLENNKIPTLLPFHPRKVDILLNIQTCPILAIRAIIVRFRFSAKTGGNSSFSPLFADQEDGRKSKREGITRKRSGRSRTMGGWGKKMEGDVAIMIVCRHCELSM